MISCVEPSQALQFQEGCEGNGYPAVFSRGDHIKSLGFYSAEELEEGMDLELDSLENSEPVQLHGQPVNSAIETNASSEDCKKEEQSWDDFKSEFDDVFRESEDKIASDKLDAMTSLSPPLVPALSSDMQNDIIIEMITSLHDSRERERKSAGKDDAGAVTTPSPLTRSSPSRPRKQLLSLSNLETIPESDIDRLLENVEGHPRTGTDSDFYSLTDSDTASPSLPLKRAWGLLEGPNGSSEGLMKQLYQLSLTQADGHQGLGEEKHCPTTSSTSASALSEVPVSHAGSDGQQNGSTMHSPSSIRGESGVVMAFSLPRL